MLRMLKADEQDVEPGRGHVFEHLRVDLARGVLQHDREELSSVAPGPELLARAQKERPSRGGLVELSDGRWLFDIRQQRGPHRWRATSSDGGKTWSTPRAGERVSAVACAIERYTLKARLAVLSLMAETTVDPRDPACRHTGFPAIAVNRLAGSMIYPHLD